MAPKSAMGSSRSAIRLGGSVTAGIISALGRNINERPYDDFLQIDAPINRATRAGRRSIFTAQSSASIPRSTHPLADPSGLGSPFPPTEPSTWSISSRSTGT